MNHLRVAAIESTHVLRSRRLMEEKPPGIEFTQTSSRSCTDATTASEVMPKCS